MRVFVYFNLHKKCWSIRAMEGNQKGRVIAHAQAVELANCTFKVSEAGRQRVLREKRKNVHAGVVGDIIAFDGRRTKAGHENNLYIADWYSVRHIMLAQPAVWSIGYNPHVATRFYIKSQDGDGRIAQQHRHWQYVPLPARYVTKAEYVYLGYKRDVWSTRPTLLDGTKARVTSYPAAAD